MYHLSCNCHGLSAVHSRCPVLYRCAPEPILQQVSNALQKRACQRSGRLDEGKGCQGAILQPAALAAASLTHWQHCCCGVSILECAQQADSIDGCSQVAKKAVTAAGYLCRGEQEQGILTLQIDVLLETAKIKSDVLPFAAGESLCFAFGGEALCPALSHDWTVNETAVHACFMCAW